MTRRGVGNKTAMSLSAHKTFSVFQRYNIVDDYDLIQASELIEGRRKVAQAQMAPAKTDTKCHTAVAHS